MKRYYVNQWNQKSYRHNRFRALKKAYLLVSEKIYSCTLKVA